MSLPANVVADGLVIIVMVVDGKTETAGGDDADEADHVEDDNDDVSSVESSSVL